MDIKKALLVKFLRKLQFKLLLVATTNASHRKPTEWGQNLP